jgi:hypothetical protein
MGLLAINKPVKNKNLIMKEPQRKQYRYVIDVLRIEIAQYQSLSNVIPTIFVSGKAFIVHSLD